MADGTVTVSIKGDDGPYKKVVRSLDAETKKALGSASGQAGGLSARMAACATAAGTFVGSIASTALTAAVSTIGDLAKGVYDTGTAFESSMANVAALSGATGDELAQLEATARQFGASTVFSASEAADALGYMALAGWDSQQSMDGLPGVLNLAAASGMGLAEASDMVTDYLTAFGLEAKDATRFSDMLAYAQANSNTTAQALGEAYKNCAANLNAAGQDVETTTSLLASMANQGLKGSEAGTALAAIMRDITSGMEDGAIAIGNASVAVTDADGNFRDLTDILADVEGATAGMGDAERAAALSATFTADSTKGLNLILNAGVGEAAAFEESLRSCDGAAAGMAETMNDTLAGDVKTLNSAMEELQLKCFDAVQPALRGLAQTATDELLPALTDALFGAEQSVPVYDELGNVCGSTQERAGGLVAELAGMAEKAAPGVEAVGGVLQGMADAAAPALQGVADAALDMAGTVGSNLSEAFDTLQPALESASDFLGGALSGAFETACGVASDLMGGVGEVSGLFTQMAEEVGPGLQAFFDGFSLDGVFDTFDRVRSSLADNFTPVWETLTSTVVPALGDAFDAIGENVGGFQDIFDTAMDAIGNVADLVFTSVGDVAQVNMQAIGDAIGIVTSVIDGDWQGALDGMASAAEDAWTGIGTLSEDIFGVNVADAVSGLCESVGAWWDDAWNGAVETFDTFAAGVQEAADTAFPGLTDAVGGVVDAVGEGDWGAAWQSAQEAAGSVMDGILASAQEAFPQTSEVIGNLVDGAQQAFDSWGIADAAQTTWDSITSTVGDLAGQAGDAAQGFIDDVAGWFGSWGVDDTTDDVWGSISSTVDDLAGQAGDTAKGFIDDAATQFKAWGIDGTVNGIWTSLKGFIDDPVGSLDSTISGFIGDVAGSFDSWGVDDTVNGIFQNVKSFMEDPIGSAQSFIEDALGTISGIVTGLDLNLPHFALPHFHVDGGVFPWGIGGSGRAPVFGVDWYAKGGVFDGPSVIGVGERGPEAVVPLSSDRMRPFAEAVAEALEDGAGGAPSAPLGDEAALLAALEGVSARLDGLAAPWQAAASALEGAAAHAEGASAAPQNVTYSCGDVVVQARDAQEAADFEGFMRDVLRRAGMYAG